VTAGAKVDVVAVVGASVAAALTVCVTFFVTVFAGCVTVFVLVIVFAGCVTVTVVTDSVVVVVSSAWAACAPDPPVAAAPAAPSHPAAANAQASASADVRRGANRPAGIVPRHSDTSAGGAIHPKGMRRPGLRLPSGSARACPNQERRGVCDDEQG
jgi:hypothetical protein